MQKSLLRLVSMSLALSMCLSLFAFIVPASADAAAPRLRPMEYMTRGLVAAQVAGGIFLSWRFLGDEPDGLSWNVYRKDGDADFVKITTITPRDVQPESNYETNPGIVKENVTPSNYTDPAGLLSSIYEVAPVINGAEGVRQGMSVPMLSALAGSAGQANRGAVHYIPMKPAPSPVPLAHFTYRGNRFGPGTNLTTANMVIPGTGGQHWYVVDMDLLRAFREPHDNKTPVSAADLSGWVDKLGEYNKETWQPTHSLGTDGIISDALYAELEAKFMKYVEELDAGPKLPYAKTGTGAIYTSQSSAYSTHDMTVGDFDGDGEYEIVVKWRSTQQDPMYSEPIFSGSNNLTAPEYIDVYKLDGTLLFRVDMGYNVRAANDHETTLFSQDFDGDGKAELMLKTALGTRIGNWDEESQSVIYQDTLNTVVGGNDGLNATTDKFKEYFASGNEQALNTYWSLLNSFTISYRSPIAGGGNDGVNDPTVKRWIKTYHVGPIGSAKDDQEFFSAFKWDGEAGKGVLIDSAKYPFPYKGSVDGENWAMTPESQRGNYSYLAFPGPGAGSSTSDYKAQIMAEKEAYWLEHPWKAAVWGDAQGNRANRYLGVVAALDGVNNYAVSQRGYYARTTFAAYNIVNGKVNLQASFDSADPRYWTLGGSAYDYQNRGNHQTQTADLDGDGRDEIVMKAMVLGLNADKTMILPKVLNGDIMPTIEGQNSIPPVADSFEFATDAVRNNPLNVWAPLRHGDRSALLPVAKDNSIRMWSGSEEHMLDDIRNGKHYGWLPGPEAHDPMKGKRLNAQGEIIYENSLVFGVYAGTDAEGAVAGNFSNRWPGAQGYSQNGARSMITGELLNGSRNLGSGQNAIWFGGGLTAMAVNSATINTVNDLTFATTSYLATGLTSTGNKSTPTLKADIFGDWREELILRGSNNRLAIVTTLSPTEYGIRTLMHDPMYRSGVANKNTGYDQMGFASFYLGDEAKLPSMRTDIAIPKTAPNTESKIKLTGPASVQPGETFDLIYSGKDLESGVMAQDLTFEFDPTVVEQVYDPVSMADEQFVVVSHKQVDGKLRVLGVHLGAKQTDPNGDLLKLSLRAKLGAEGNTSILLSKVITADANGVETTFDGVSHSLRIEQQVVVDKSALNALIADAQAKHDKASEGSGVGSYPAGTKATLQLAIDQAKAVANNPAADQAAVNQATAQLQTALQTFLDAVIKPNGGGDFNNDNKISIGDLALAAKAYGKSSADSDWNSWKQFDLSGDDVVDIEDLVILATQILN
ncbi:cohesin domain-containing protein [Paenibacillus sp. P36]|uniref:rhamnogalacturonan lyase family protein n=1 Tax=Paenibacillus sp. P36 TaxID=3342538 RepID=UPI0038B2F612